MALIRCNECGNDVSDKAATCPKCGAPVDATAATPRPDLISYWDARFHGTRDQLVDLAKVAVAKCNYRIDAVDTSGGTLTFTTGTTLGSFAGVTATLSWQETAPYTFRVTGTAKQNVKGGQVLALNLFNEAESKVSNVIREMRRAAGDPEAQKQAQPGGACLLYAMAIVGGVGVLIGAGTMLV